jgi:hypothetical protein
LCWREQEMPRRPKVAELCPEHKTGMAVLRLVLAVPKLVPAATALVLAVLRLVPSATALVLAVPRLVLAVPRLVLAILRPVLTVLRLVLVVPKLSPAGGADAVLGLVLAVLMLVGRSEVS